MAEAGIGGSAERVQLEVQPRVQQGLAEERVPEGKRGWGGFFRRWGESCRTSRLAL